jgi:hypothetical protein
LALHADTRCRPQGPPDESRLGFPLCLSVHFSLSRLPLPSESPVPAHTALLRVSSRDAERRVPRDRSALLQRGDKLDEADANRPAFSCRDPCVDPTGHRRRGDVTRELASSSPGLAVRDRFQTGSTARDSPVIFGATLNRRASGPTHVPPALSYAHVPCTILGSPFSLLA